MSTFPGEDVTWMCSVQSTTDLTFTWYINGVVVSSEMGTASGQIISNSYTLTNINYTDSNSVVMCEAAGNSVTVESDNVTLTGRLCYFCLSYSMIVPYSRDHKGYCVAHEKHHPKTSLIFPDNDEAVLVR